MFLKKIPHFLLLLFLSLTFSGCQNKPATMQALPTIQSGKATVVGILVSEQGNKPFSETIVRLAEVYYQGDKGAYALDVANSPGAITDKNGYFIFPNIVARKYVFVVGDPMGSYLIYQDKQGTAVVWDATADKVLDLGTIKVNYTP
ncbi:MAG: hypothetical protein PHQ40_17300 [Anaerolineaceae bacterium]|nr:hypothetical protein [Anaerolineaceae bacterium]